MRAGTLRHRLVFLRPTEGQPNEYNELEYLYEPDFELWGEVNDLYGTEAVRAKQIAAEASVSVTVRGHDGITQTHRIEHGDRELEIVSILDSEGRGRELTILCKEDV